MLSDDDIARIAERIARGYAPLVVGTFGSYAIGTARPQSDLDLFVIKQTNEAPMARRRAVQRLLFGVLHPLDIHVFTPGEFEDAATKELSFEWIIAKQARVFYCVDHGRQWVRSLQHAFDRIA
jgi:uncharacterized protein